MTLSEKMRRLYSVRNCLYGYAGMMCQVTPEMAIATGQNPETVRLIQEEARWILGDVMKEIESHGFDPQADVDAFPAEKFVLPTRRSDESVKGESPDPFYPKELN